MLTLLIPLDVLHAIERACKRAGFRETGGMLFGEHLAAERFRVVEATVAGEGSFARFVRGIREGVTRLNDFFRRTHHDYQRFNYIGEWHSHPSFALSPSGTDDASMFEIVNDESTNARFAISMIVKLSGRTVAAAAFAYFPTSSREDVQIEFDTHPQ